MTQEERDELDRALASHRGEQWITYPTPAPRLEVRVSWAQLLLLCAGWQVIVAFFTSLVTLWLMGR